MENQNKLYRSVKSKVIGGVAGGLSEYFNIDVVVVRLLFVLLLLFSGGGLLAYIILWIVIPQRPVLVNNTAAYYENENMPSHASRSVIAGIILIFLGLLFLFDNLIPWYNLRLFWPVILIIAGFLVMFPNVLKSKLNTENHEK